MPKYVYDPRLCMMVEAPKKPEDDIRLMSQHPAFDGWIKIVKSRVNLASPENQRYSVIRWYDHASMTLSTDHKKEDAVPFRSFVLPNGGGRPAGWLRAKTQKG